MVGIGDGLRPISTSIININTFSIIVKILLDDILIPTYTDCTITPTITSFVFVNTIINMARITGYTQQSTMVNYGMGVILSVLGSISTFPITTNSFSHIARVKVPGIFRPGSTSAIINSYIPPRFAIIMNFIPPPITIITTDVTLLRSVTTISTSLFFVNLSICTTRIH